MPTCLKYVLCSALIRKIGSLRRLVVVPIPGTRGIHVPNSLVDKGLPNFDTAVARRRGEGYQDYWRAVQTRSAVSRKCLVYRNFWVEVQRLFSKRKYRAGPDVQRQVRSLVSDCAFVPDLQSPCIEVDNRIHDSSGRICHCPASPSTLP